MATVTPSAQTGSTTRVDHGHARSAQAADALLEALREGIGVIDADGRLVDVSERLCQMTGYSADELVGALPPYPFWPEAEHERIEAALRRTLAGSTHSFELTFQRKSGELFPVLVDVITLPEVNGRPGALCTARDITQQARERAQLVSSEARLRETQDVAGIGDWEWDPATDTLSAAEAVNELFGTELGSIASLAEATAFVDPEQRQDLVDGLRVVALGGPSFSARVEVTAPSAKVTWVEIRARRFEQPSCGILVRGTIQDVTEQMRSGDEARAARDYLRAVTRSMGEGLITVDVTGRIAYANEAAELLLGWTARELVGRRLHETTHHHRPDGSEYPAAECPMVRSRTEGTRVRVEDDVFFRKDGTGVPVEYTSAPIEMEDGVKGAVIVFNDISERKSRQEQMQRDLEALAWLERIRDALREDRFTLHAQPIVDVRSGETVQHELLIRMLDEDGAVVPPGHFLPVAERYGVIREIDRWVVRQAARLVATGRPIELNLSAESISDPELYGVVERELSRMGADPALMVIEVTETALIRNEEVGRDFLQRVGRLGCQVALDDFGTGYGGLSYVKRLPVDYLKIDMEFVRDLPRDTGSQSVVRAIVSLAKDFGQRTVAEGVEDQATFELLREMGVDFAQGYHLGRPAPVEDAGVV